MRVSTSRVLTILAAHSLVCVLIVSAVSSDPGTPLVVLILAPGLVLGVAVGYSVRHTGGWLEALAAVVVVAVVVMAATVFLAIVVHLLFSDRPLS